jgi:ribose-phosphate pyrophosphokinase
MKVIAGSSNQKLASAISTELDIPELRVDLHFFPNGEKQVCINDEIQGENVVLVQSFSRPVDEHIMETLLMIDALERLGARHVNVVIPWLGYSLQDKAFRMGEPISAAVIARLISHAHTKRAFLLDIHNSSTPGFFSIPTHHLSATDMFVTYVKTTFKNHDVAVASPDFGGLKRANSFANLLDTELIKIDKHRDLKSREIVKMGLSGDVRGKTIILLDDVIVSGSTAMKAATLLKEAGAEAIYFMATHGIFTDDSIQQLAASDLDGVVVTDSIAHPELPPEITQLPTGPLFAAALRSWV